MKEMMNRIINFVTFDSPLQTDVIADRFKSIHTHQQNELPLWSTVATRHKIISEYWYENVMKHFSILFGLSCLLTLLVTHQLSISIAGLVFAGVVSFLVLYFFHYKPLYYSIFLPKLETAKEACEQKFREQLNKCRQAQLPNFTLVLIYYVFAQCLEIKKPLCDENSALLIMTLFGVDDGSIKRSLEMLLVNSKRKDLSERRKTEFKNRFHDAYAFFEKIGLVDGMSKLKQLEVQFFSDSKNLY
jgi:hypothetical protein